MVNLGYFTDGSEHNTRLLGLSNNLEAQAG
jgi:hypothetical protein